MESLLASFSLGGNLLRGYVSSRGEHTAERDRERGRKAPAAAASVPASEALKNFASALTLTMREPQRAMAIAILPR